LSFDFCEDISVCAKTVKHRFKEILHIMNTYCYFLAISCLTGHNLHGNQFLLKICSEFMELSSNFQLESFHFWKKERQHICS